MISLLSLDYKMRPKRTYLQNKNTLTNIENRLVVVKSDKEDRGEGWIGSLGLVDANYYI